MKTRTEKDTLGEIEVPASARWGAQTQRALENTVAVSRLPAALWRALLIIKAAAARVNGELGLVETATARAIEQAARTLIDSGEVADFPLSPYMTGSGTSANMNVNEVLSHLAAELLAAAGNAGAKVHPNDHVNRCQSSNDVFPSALNVSAHETLAKVTIPGLQALQEALEEKAAGFEGVMKLGRTHLMDALPVRLGSEFGAYASQVKAAIARIEQAKAELTALPLGGTAVGTGVNAHPEFAPRTIALIAEETGAPFVQQPDLFEGLSSRDNLVAASGALKSAATALMKIANDIRWMGSGPGGGLGELVLPTVQPGSSIMPGKVNPVIPEAVLASAARVMGNDVTIGICGARGVLELNLMMPLMAAAFVESAVLVGESAKLLAQKCVAGLQANTGRCAAHLEKSLALVTPLARKIGYDLAAEVAKKAYREKITLREAALAMAVMEPDELDRLLDPATMV